MTIALRAISGRIFAALALAAMLLSIHPPHASAENDTTPEALIAELYAEHAKRAGNDGPRLWEDPLTREGYFSEALLDTFAEAAESTDPDNAPRLNGDPLYDAQEWEISELAIKPLGVVANSAKVSVTFKNFSKPKELTYILEQGKTGWRIEDIEYKDADGDYSLMELLAD